MTGVFVGILIAIAGIILFAMWSKWEYVRDQKKASKGEMEGNDGGIAENEMGMNDDDGQ